MANINRFLYRPIALPRMDLQVFADGDPQPKSGGYSAEYVQELRNEAAAWRTKLREAEQDRDSYKTKLDAANTKLKDLEGQNQTLKESVCKTLGLDAAKADTDTITTKMKEVMSSSDGAVEKAQEALRKSVFIAAAVKKGIRKEALEDAYKLADFSAVKVDLDSLSVFQVDKDGKQIMKDNSPVLGLDSLVENLAKEKPYLVGKSGGIGGSTNPGGDNPPAADEWGKEAAERQSEQMKKQVEGQDLYFK